jgi:hypothetical protein
MANIKISAMSAAGALSGTEVVAGLQGGDNVAINVQDIADLASGGGGSVTTNKIPISSAELLAMNVTPKVLVAAQGANTLIVPINLVMRYNYGTIDYATNLGIILDEAGGLFTTTFTNALSGSSTKLISKAVIPTTSVSPTSLNVNQSLKLTVGTGNPTAGDGTVDAYITYIVVNL